MRACCLIPLALLLGCPGETPPDPVDTDLPTDTGDAPDPEPRTDVSGTVVDTTGAGIFDAQIRFCRGALCLNTSTDATGAWSLDDVVAAPTSLEILGDFEGGMATAFSAVTLEENVPRTFAVTLLPLDAASPLTATPEWYTVGAGLRVEVGLSDLEPPAFIDAATEVAGVLVPPAAYPPLDGIENVLAVWFVDPFDHHAPAGLPVEIDNSFGLGDGETARIYVGEYASSSWLDAGLVTASGDLLSGDARLPLMSTVVLTGPISSL